MTLWSADVIHIETYVLIMQTALRGLIMAKKAEESKYKKLEEKLFSKKENGWLKFGRAELGILEKMNREYMAYISKCKNERLFIDETIAWAENNGFKPLESYKGKLKSGDKLYIGNRGKNLLLAVIGRKGVNEGMNIVASHVDAPRLDIKPNPLYEDGDSAMALMKTHYYGGIKKYQWVNRPLSLVGIAALKDGTTVEINIGEEPDDPCFVISDLLPHLASKAQGDLKAGEVIKGEQLNIIVGSVPVNDADVKEKIKMMVLEKLNNDYGITEDDFISSELEVVPSGMAREIGFDRGLIGAYGHDDRVCAYGNLWALMNMKKAPEKTAVVFLADKEEIGSYGSTGMDSNFFYHGVSKIIDAVKPGSSEIFVRDCLAASSALSTDVSAGVNPEFKQVHDMRNAPKLGYGVNFCKYTGSRGKAGSNDADAEYIARLRKLLDDGGVPWQLTELGKVDEGGGGTVAWLLARWQINTIDMGVALVGMHSPFELASKIDIYACGKACKLFLEEFV